jgi:ubiquinone/menaquinone biosynthesis C-methylase UbiE
MNLNKTHRERIISSYNDAFMRNGYHTNALLWSSKEVQELRFEKLANIGIKTGDSILDIGCGFGDFYAYLQKQGVETNFTGIDLSENLLLEGRKQYPDVDLQQGDLFDLNPDKKSFDYVTLSGTLNNKLDDEGEYAYQVIERMWKICRKGIAFNLLDARHEWTGGRWDLQSFYPEEIAKFMRQFSDNIEIVDDYLENDFTVLAQY